MAIIGAALDLGAGRRGVDMGPSAIRYAGLNERLERAEIAVEDRGNVESALAETQATGSERARFLAQILETCRRIADEVVCAESPEPFSAVGQWYDDFSQTSDEEVRQLLALARTEHPGHASRQRRSTAPASAGRKGAFHF